MKLIDSNLKYNTKQKILVAIDCTIFGFDSKSLKLLLFRRKVEPLKGSWSLIGAFIENDLSIVDGAKRILLESTGLKDIYLEQLKTYGEVDRDPLERVISVGFYSLIRIDELDIQSVEDYDAKWFDIDEVPELILDHGTMVKDAITALQHEARHKPIGFNLLPDHFTLPQLQALYESIYQSKRDSRNFRKKVLSLNILEKTDLKDKTGSKKGAFLYTFRKNVKLEENGQDFLFDLY
jgi:ADP-ribose pyrophosphatase YjhB (NUDIX family)